MDYVSQAILNPVVTGTETNGCLEDRVASGILREVADGNVKVEMDFFFFCFN